MSPLRERKGGSSGRCSLFWKALAAGAGLCAVWLDETAVSSPLSCEFSIRRAASSRRCISMSDMKVWFCC